MDKGTSLKKIPLVLITGFLGSGKTSLLRQILYSSGDSGKVAIVQNEFAPGRVDSAELESTRIKFNLLEINNGSVFCACLLDDFISRLEEFITIYKPGVIFLEATGLADPVSMSQIMQAPGVKDHIFLGGIWTVIDSVNFNRAHKYIQRVRHQVQMADLIILNKSDLEPPGPGMLEQLEAWNPKALQRQSIRGQFSDLQKMLKEITYSEIRNISLQDSLPADSMPRPDIGSCVIRTQKTFKEQDLKDFYSNNRNRIFRMKGFAKTPDGNCNLVQGVFGDLIIEKFDGWNGPSEIIIMGPGIEPGPISRELLKIGRNAKKHT